MRRLSPVAAAVAAITMLALLAQPVQAEDGTTADSTTGIEIDTPVSGEDAIDALGDDLAVVAAEHDLTAKELTTMLRTDEGLQVGPNGRLVAAAPAAPAGLVGTSLAEAANWDWSGIADGDAFSLNSRPGATKTIYLNFKGLTLSSSAWNWWTRGYGMPKTVTGFNLEGSASTYTTSELRAIKWIWASVAEDFAPFDVNVTTQPANYDALNRNNLKDINYGTQVVITSQTGLSNYTCGACSGVAFIDTFSHYAGKKYGKAVDTSATVNYQPAWVFTPYTGDSATYIAETASHEAGHNLGLLHTGLKGGSEYYAGHGANWAPIMGTSTESIHRPLTQWTRGDFRDYKVEQDQVAKIRSHGLGTRADEAGDTVAGSVKATTGIISSSADKDTVLIGYCSSASNVVVETATLANLDVRAELLDGSGTVLSTHTGNVTGRVDDGISGVGFPSTFNVPSNTGVTVPVPAGGPYHLRISGEGSAPNEYTAYGSLGQWRVTVPCASGSTPQPGAPVVSVSPGNKAAKVNWTWPTSGRIQDITGWRVQRMDTGATSSFPLGTRTTTFTGLTNGTPVDFRVVALIGASQTPASTWSAPVTATPRTVTSAPRIGKASSGKKGGKKTAVVRWSAPTATNGAPITHYRITAYRYKGKKIAATYTSPWLPASTRSYEMTVPKKASYRFSVAAKNSAGWSPLSAKSNKVSGR